MATDPRLAGPVEPASSARRALSWALALGLISALLAALFLHRYQQEVSGGESVLILRASRPIESGTLLRDEMLIEASVPSGYVEARAVRAVDRGKVSGVRIASSLDTQDALLWSDLAVAQEHTDLSRLVQPGSRALSVNASLIEQGGAAWVRPGDYVDVLATLDPSGDAAHDVSKLVSLLLLQRILVLAVGAPADPQLPPVAARSDALVAPDTETLTLSVKLDEAQLLSLALEHGRLSVLLRQPDDTRILEEAPEMPASRLFDGPFRNALQRRRNSEPRPVRLSTSVVSAR